MAKTKKAALKKSAVKKVVAKKAKPKATTWAKGAKDVKTGSQVIPYIPRKIDRLPADLNKLKK
tara:strand:+ start:274 stop:462 length:189 start_codon:yes stop_codon:yes gene_type:complete